MQPDQSRPLCVAIFSFIFGNNVRPMPCRLTVRTRTRASQPKTLGLGFTFPNDRVMRAHRPPLFIYLTPSTPDDTPTHQTLKHALHHPLTTNANHEEKKMKVRIKSYTAPAAWRWDTGTTGQDTCGICQNRYEEACSECPFPGDECPVSTSPFLPCLFEG